MAARIFPGWWVVAAVFIVLSAASGLIFYGLAVYLDALTDEQPFSRCSLRHPSVQSQPLRLEWPR